MNEHDYDDDMFEYEEERMIYRQKEKRITKWDIKEWYYGSRYIQKKLSKITVNIFLDFYIWLEKADVNAILKALRREQ